MAKSDYGKRASEGWTSPAYEKSWLRIYGEPCEVCQKRGYHKDWNEQQRVWIKTKCLICKGNGYIERKKK